MGAKYLGHYGGYESFLEKLLEYHKNNNIKYYVACKANGDGMMNPDTLDGAVRKIGDYTVVTSSVNYANTSALLVKRGMDILGGLVGCLFTLIIMIFVGPAIYIASPEPIFFAQERVGRNGRKFKVYKFRSMYMDAEERKKELMAQNKVGGRNNITDFEEVVKLDTQYIGEWSVKGDIKIIWQTAVGVLRNDGAM